MLFIFLPHQSAQYLVKINSYKILHMFIKWNDHQLYHQLHPIHL